MEGAGIAPNLVSYSTAVAAYARTAQPDEAMRVLNRMRAAGISPDVVTYNAVIDANARAGRLLQAQALLNKLERGEAGAETAADVVSYTILISAMARRGKLQEANKLLSHMQRNTTVTPDTPCFNALIGGYASRGMWGAVSRLMGQMAQSGVRPDPYTYGPLLESCRKAGHRQRARRYGKEMLLVKDLPLSPFCMASLRKTLGNTQLQQLCRECDVPWRDVEKVIARNAQEQEERRNRAAGLEL